MTVLRRIPFLVAIVVGRLTVACDAYEQSEDPRFQPFLKSSATLVSQERTLDDFIKVRFSIVAAMRRKTYHCSTDSTAGSCASSQDPDDHCYDSPSLDFGRFWGEVVTEELALESVEVEHCEVGRTDCARKPATFVESRSTPAYDRIAGGRLSIFEATVEPSKPAERPVVRSCLTAHYVGVHADGRRETLSASLGCT